MKISKRLKRRSFIFASLVLVFLLMVSIKSYTPCYFINADKVDEFSKQIGEELDSISLATFNAGILYGKLFGQTVLEPVPFSEQRLEELAQYLMAIEMDIIGIQEVYYVSDKDKIIREVKDKYPYAIYFKRKQFIKLGLNNGLMFLSRYPISNALFERYRNNPFTDKIMADKGVMAISINGKRQKLVISNTHTTAGGVIYHIESDKANAIRMKQIKQSIALTDLLAGDRDTKIILGDFNAGPEASAVNYLAMEEYGYADSYTWGCTQDCNAITWTLDNRLNDKGYFPDSPPQRIDHIFIKAPIGYDFKVLQTSVILQEEVVLVDNNERVSLSDHYGYFCSISLQ